VDIYLPDLKYAEDEAGYLYSKVRSYREVSRAAIAEMHRQTVMNSSSTKMDC